jgi:hypothetical protein
VTGIRPFHSSDWPARASGRSWGTDERLAPDPQQFVQHQIGPLGGLQGLAEDGIVKRRVGIVGQIGIGIALDHRQSARDAFCHAVRIEFHPARINPAVVAQRRHQAPSPQPTSSTRAARCDIGGDNRKVGAQAHWFRNPAMTRSSAGTSSRKLSCPNGADSSTKLTGAPAALSACAIRDFRWDRASRYQS